MSTVQDMALRADAGENVDPVHVVRKAMAAFAADLEAGKAQRAQLDAIQTTGDAALTAQSREWHSASRAERSARGPQPARLVPVTQPENLIRLTDDAATVICDYPRCRCAVASGGHEERAAGGPRRAPDRR